MLSSPWFYLTIIGLIIIITLSVYAGRLLWLVKQQRLEQQKAAQTRKLALKQHDQKIFKSVSIIVKAMREEQCEHGEGCWRLSVLLDSLKMSANLSEQFPAIFELYNRIKELDILDARKSLDKKQRMQQDVIRMKAEAELFDKVNKDLTLLAQFSQERLSALAE